MAKKNEIPKEHLMTNNVLLKKLWELQQRKTLESVENKKILVVHELETAIILAVQNAVTYVTDDYDAYTKFKGMTGTEEFGGDDEAYFVDGVKITWKNFIKEIEEIKRSQNGNPIKTSPASSC